MPIDVHKKTVDQTAPRLILNGLGRKQLKLTEVAPGGVREDALPKSEISVLLTA